MVYFILAGFDSDSDSDSDTEERGRKIHVEIKPLNNGTAPISASVDELRATVENLSLSPLGALSVCISSSQNIIQINYIHNIIYSRVSCVLSFLFLYIHSSIAIPIHADLLFAIHSSL